jgi:hypothetical protein
MDNVKGVLVILVLLLGAGGFLLYIQLAASNNQLALAREAGNATLNLLQAQNVPDCGSSPTDFTRIANCIRPALLQKDFREDSFAQPNAKTGASGYVVIKNTNRKSYDATRFTFYKNRALTQTGCTLPGTIDYNVVCRFNFDTPCVDGDVLEVKYSTNITGEPTETKVFTKNC